MIREIDDFILDSRFGVQKISETIEYFTYLSHTAQARVLAIVGLAIAVVLNWKLIASGDESASWLRLLWLNFVLFIMLMHSIVVEKMLSKKGFRNPEREKRVGMRVFLLLLSVFNVTTGGISLIEIHLVALPVFLYLLACQPLPPGDRFFDKVHRTVEG